GGHRRARGRRRRSVAARYRAAGPHPCRRRFPRGRLAARGTPRLAVQPQGEAALARRQGALAPRGKSGRAHPTRPGVRGGRLTGHTRADGGFGRLALDVDWLFRDSLVAGWPETRVSGRGDVDLFSGGLTFRGFGVDAATVDLRTVHRLAPTVTLNGLLDAA